MGRHDRKYQVRKKSFKKQMEEIRIRYENNLKIRNAIDKQSAKLLELERNWTQVREISDTVNGKIKGGSKEKRSSLRPTSRPIILTGSLPVQIRGLW